jgi:hypothetical protein
MPSIEREGGFLGADRGWHFETDSETEISATDNTNGLICEHHRDMAARVIGLMY